MVFNTKLARYSTCRPYGAGSHLDAVPLSSEPARIRLGKISTVGEERSVAVVDPQGASAALGGESFAVQAEGAIAEAGSDLDVVY